MSRTTTTVALLILVVGCTTQRGFDRGELSSALAPELIVTEEEIARVLDLDPQLPRPFKLGVYFKRPVARHWASGWTWLSEDKELFLQAGKSLQSPGFVSEVVFISPATAASEEIKSIRLAAARHGVDAVLVVSGISDVDRYNNALGPTYALLVTALFVPGTVVDGLFISHAGLWDVRNGFLYASAEVDGTASQTRPAVVASEQDVIADAKAESLSALADAVRQHITSLGG